MAEKLPSESEQARHGRLAEIHGELARLDQENESSWKSVDRLSSKMDEDISHAHSEEEAEKIRRHFLPQIEAIMEKRKEMFTRIDVLRLEQRRAERGEQ